jgi:hypothetical protein
MLVTTLFYLLINNVVYSNTYAGFSDVSSCAPINFDNYKSHSLFSPLIDSDELIIYSKFVFGNDALSFYDGQETLVEGIYQFGRSSMFLSQFLKLKKYIIDNYGEKLWPKQIKLVYAGNQLPGLYGVGALFCRDYQSADEMVLVVTTNTLSDSTIFARTLSHELYHYMIHIKGTNIPFWLEEGLAINFEDTLSDSVSSASMMDYHMTEAPWTSFSKLGNGYQITKEELFAFYGQANLLVYYIQKNIGTDLPKLFLLSEFKSWLRFLEQSIRPNWRDFKDMFIDFQVAKYINRPDYYNLDGTDIYKYQLLPQQLSGYVVEADRTKISFEPEPLSGFIPQDVDKYINHPNYTVIWILLPDYSAIQINTSIDNAPYGSFPLVIRWK